MPKNTISRRTVLRGMLGGAAVEIALPPLEAMLNCNGTAYADGTGFPRRFGIFFWGNGVDLARWIPTGEGASWAPGEELTPLLPVKDYVSVISGLVLPVRGGIAHYHGRAQILTGSDERQSEYGPPSHPSLDQIVAKAWRGQTRFPSIEVGVSRHGPSNQESVGAVAVTEQGRLLPQETSPRRLFDRVFGGANAAVGSEEWKTARARTRVLDAVKVDAECLRGRLGRADRDRLEAHMATVGDIERRLTPVPGQATCTLAPSRPPARTDSFGHEDLEWVNRAMADLLALILACDLTRSFSYAYSQLQSDTIFWQLGHREGLHVLSHTAEASVEACHQAATFTMSGLAYLIQKLKDTPQGDGNLLDCLCLMATSEVSTGLSHSTDDLPILIVGRAGGALRQGIHYRSRTAENTNRLLLSLLQATGLPMAEFGYGTGRTSEPLRAVLA